jgi:hypothetical protein
VIGASLRARGHSDKLLSVLNADSIQKSGYLIFSCTIEFKSIVDLVRGDSFLSNDVQESLHFAAKGEMI